MAVLDTSNHFGRAAKETIASCLQYSLTWREFKSQEYFACQQYIIMLTKYIIMLI
jgi:hypothetical protein